MEGELFDGCFTFYGDFAKQAIYSPETSLEILGNYTYFAKKKLSVNCRNTKNIGNEIVNVTGYEDTRYLFSVAGEPVEYYSWKDLDEEKEALKKVLKTLKVTDNDKYSFKQADTDETEDDGSKETWKTVQVYKENVPIAVNTPKTDKPTTGGNTDGTSASSTKKPKTKKSGPIYQLQLTYTSPMVAKNNYPVIDHKPVILKGTYTKARLLKKYL